MPKTPFRSLLGPLFKFAVRQLLRKALDEDKRDLEGAGYRPGAAGNVEAAVAAFLPEKPSADAARHMLRGAAFVSYADGTLDVAERDALARVAKALGSEETLESALAEASKIPKGDELDDAAEMLDPNSVSLDALGTTPENAR